MVAKFGAHIFAALLIASSAQALPVHARTLAEQLGLINGFEDDCTKLLHSPTEAFNDATLMSVSPQGQASIRVSGVMPSGANVRFSSDSVLFENSRGQKRQFNFGLTKEPMTTGDDGAFSFVVVIPRGQTATFKIVMHESVDQDYTLTIALDRKAQISRAELVPVFKDDIRKKLCPRDRLSVSSGVAFFSYTQKLTAVNGSLGYSSIGVPTGSLVYNHVGSPKNEDVYALKSLQGKILTGSNFNGDLSFNWLTASYHHQFRFTNAIRDWRGSMLHPFARAGVQLHQLPMVRLDLADTVSIDQNTMANASIGGGVTLFTERNFMSEIYLDVQYPLYASTKVDYGLMFDGSISLFQTIGSRLFWGVQWFGQYQQLRYTRTGFDRTGSISFLSSNAEATVGYRF